MNRKMIPFQFLNEAKDGKQVITLSGTIRKRYWDGDKCIDAKLLRDALDGVKEDVIIRLNSNGGDAFEGVEMCNYLKDHPAHITVEVTGLAASAATLILCGADITVMDVGTTMMIHEASTLAWGNKTDLKKTLDGLETIDQSILDIYTDRTGQTAEQITEWVSEAKWFTADEAVRYGFADEVKRKSKSATDSGNDLSNLINQAVAQAMSQYQPQAALTPGTEPTKQKSLLSKLRKGD